MVAGQAASLSAPVAAPDETETEKSTDFHEHVWVTEHRQ
jgi:hypothetical protein